MSSKRTSTQGRRAFAPRRRKVRVIVAVVVVVSLFAAWTLLASSGALDSVLQAEG